MSKRYVCDDCGYNWTSKKLYGDPAFCPSCKSEDVISNLTIRCIKTPFKECKEFPINIRLY